MAVFLYIFILSLVEGITEFLPISSTGHLILVEHLLNQNYFSKTFMNSFLIIIQLGAILSVVLYFWKDISPFSESREEFIFKFRLWIKIIIGVIPAGIMGILLDDIIDAYFLDNILIIAITLIFYGFLLILIEKRNKNIKARITNFPKLKYRTAFLIGFFQCLALIPGTSRSGATIIGALLLGVARPIAAEFSFYLAIPTMLGATFLKLIKNGFSFSATEWLYLGLGTFLSFIIAFITIKWFMNFIKKKNFTFFGVYRIIIGFIILISIFLKLI